MSQQADSRQSFIEQLFSGGSRKRKDEDEAANQALDIALTRLTQAMNENHVATVAVRRRQSSGSLKLVSLPEPLGAE